MKLAGKVHLEQLGTPVDLAGCSIFLASAAADYVVAQTFNVDGGNWMS